MSGRGRPDFNVAVFCGARAGLRPGYAADAASLGHELARRGMGIVCGGSRTGLMGAVTDAALSAGGHVEGVVPDFLLAHEIAHPGLTLLVPVKSMHERKALMVEHSDAIVALPGGFGTCDELFEALTWAQLGLHSKPLWLLDTAGYFAPLEAALDHMVREGFASADDTALLRSVPSVPALVEELDAFRRGNDEARRSLLLERKRRLRVSVEEELHKTGST